MYRTVDVHHNVRGGYQQGPERRVRKHTPRRMHPKHRSVDTHGTMRRCCLILDACLVRALTALCYVRQFGKNTNSTVVFTM